MLESSMFEIFGIQIHLYGITAALGIYAGFSVASWVAQKSKIDVDIIWDSLVWLLVSGLIGARAYHVIDLWSYYSQYPQDIIAVWKGGLGIFGAIFAGSLGLWLYTRYKKITTTETLKLADIAAISLPLGQAIGRWGNYFNQELYGSPSTLPWALYIRPENRLAGFENFERFQPLFLYESLLNFVLCGVLLWLFKSRRIPLGKLKFVAVYMIGYSLIRFFLEFVRLEKWQIGSIPTAQLISVLLFISGIYFLTSFNYEKFSKK